MFKAIAKLFKRQPTAAQRQAKLENDLATLTLIKIAAQANRK